MSQDQLYRLLKKYRMRQCSSGELQQLEDWYKQFDCEAEKVPEIPKEKLDILFLQIEKQIKPAKHPLLRVKIIGRYVTGIAAAVAIVIGATFFLNRRDMQVVSQQQSIVQEIQPGHWQAEVILSDGSRIKLNNSTVVKEKTGLMIKGESARELNYTQENSSAAAESYNTIVVPQGGEYGVILSDGTRVRLNSGTTLKYPIAFSGDRREVILSGEAYFDVKKSSKPFIVKTFDLDVKVLGTAFNIAAYGGDPCVTTALVRGTVEVCNNHDDRKYQLSPGNVLSYTKKSDVVVVEEDGASLYNSWIDGIFRFKNMRLEDIMRTLNRWYNCNVRFENDNLRELRFSGAAEKDRPVEYVLDVIRKITDVNFRIDGATIVVKNK